MAAALTGTEERHGQRDLGRLRCRPPRAARPASIKAHVPGSGTGETSKPPPLPAPVRSLGSPMLAIPPSSNDAAETTTV